MSLGLFLEAGLLFCGSYLLADAMLQPLDAGTVSVVGGGMFLGLATVLLFYLAWPGTRTSISRREKSKERILEIPLIRVRRAGAAAAAEQLGQGQKGGLLRPM